MTKPICLIYAVIVTMICCSLSFAQEREITAAEFKAQCSSAGKNTAKLAHRILQKTESFLFEPDSGIPVNSESVQEFVPPNKRHSVFKIHQPNRIYTLEAVSIGDARFLRHNGDAWKSDSDQHNAKNNATRSYEKRETLIKYKFVGTVDFNSQKAGLYEQVGDSKSVLMQKTADGKPQEQHDISTWRYWFGHSGLILKIEMVQETLKPERRKVINTMVYEYDPNIQIEIPEGVKQENK